MMHRQGEFEIRISRVCEVVCQGCQGAGDRVYGSTATWRGGIGGAAMTLGVCDVCWGSGDSAHPWENLRKLQKDKWEQVCRLARAYLEHGLGAGIGLFIPVQRELADHVEAIAKKRKTSYDLRRLCALVAKTLRNLANAGRDWRESIPEDEVQPNDMLPFPGLARVRVELDKLGFSNPQDDVEAGYILGYARGSNAHNSATEQLQTLHKQVADMCEFLGVDPKEVPADTWTLRDAIIRKCAELADRKSVV